MADEHSYRDFLFEHENERHLAYFAAIGRIIIAWGMLESQFNSNIMLLFSSLGGNSQAKEPPRALGKKIDFWNKCFRNLPVLADKRAFGLAYGEALKSTAEARNLMIHTNWGNVMSDDKTDYIVGGGMNSDALGFTHYNTSMSLISLHKLTNDIANGQTTLLPFTFHLVRLSNQK